MYQVGIDIGSSAAKTVVLRDGEIWKTMEMATGFSSRKTADEIYEWLEKEQVAGEGTRYGATGYGRVSVPYADKVITEITCHGKGAWKLFGKDGVVIDIGGQDTKGIVLKSGRVMKFVMNDKCSAGTGKFLEVMTNRLGLTQKELSELASQGKDVTISSMCTVFAESEVISMIGEGRSREDIAAGVVHSVAEKVAQLARRKQLPGTVILTGGLSECPYFAEILSEKLECNVSAMRDGRYAGALGAALLAREKTK